MAVPPQRVLPELPARPASQELRERPGQQACPPVRSQAPESLALSHPRRVWTAAVCPEVRFPFQLENPAAAGEPTNRNSGGQKFNP